MKYVLFLYTESDSDEAEELKDYLQVSRLRNVADMRNITGIFAEGQDFREELRRSDCVVLIGSRKASSLIQNKKQEADDDFITFDGKVIYKEFTENQELVKDRLIIVFLKERTKNDWIPTGFDEKRIFNLQGEKIKEGPLLYYLEYSIRRILLGTSAMM